MKCYFVVPIKISDDSFVADYVANVTPLVHKHGGQYIARTPHMEKLEGAGDPPDIFVLVEWPSKEAAKAFYDDPAYQPYKQSRQAGSSGDFFMVAGEDIAAE